MTRTLILNGTLPYSFAPGRLNATLTNRARDRLTAAGHAVRVTTIDDGYDVEAEVESHQWADAIILQFPVNWMGVPWTFKKYMDEVYTAGMDGRLSTGDGRSAAAPTANYGMGGTQGDTRYMLSPTFNAPREAFDNPAEPFFAGRSVDDLLAPVHLTMRFFGMTALPSFVAFDVMKNPQIDRDLARFDAHLDAHLIRNSDHAAA